MNLGSLVLRGMTSVSEILKFLQPASTIAASSSLSLSTSFLSAHVESFFLKTLQHFSALWKASLKATCSVLSSCRLYTSSLVEFISTLELMWASFS